MHELRHSTMRGASVPELAIAVPALLLTFYSLFYFGLYLFTRGTINAGLQHGLSLAAVLEDVEVEDDQDDKADTVKNEKARGAVVERSLAFPSKGLVGAGKFAEIIESRLILPDDPDDAYWNPKSPADTGASRKDVLQEYPMSMAAKVRFRSPVPFFFKDFEVQLRASGYREPRFNSGVPRALDCLGNVIGTGPLPSEEACLIKTYCDKAGKKVAPTCDTKSTPPTQILDKEKCACACLNPFEKNLGTSCACKDCEDDKHIPYYDSAKKQCLCVCKDPSPDAAKYDQDKVTCKYWCKFECPDGKAERTDASCGDCVCKTPPKCKDNERLSSDRCSCEVDPCKAENCKAPKKFDAKSCVCACEPCKGSTSGPKKDGSCDCSCLGASDDEDKDRTCTCKLDAKKCAEKGKLFDGGNCKCYGCPDGKELNKDGLCVCKKKDRDECAENPAKEFVEGACICQCPGVCSGPRSFNESCECRCPKEKEKACVGDGKALDGSCNCICNCPEGMESRPDAKVGCHCEFLSAK